MSQESYESYYLDENPDVGWPRMRVVTFKMPEDDFMFLDEFARERNMTRSEVIRRAVKQYISKHRGEVRKPFITRRMKIYT